MMQYLDVVECHFVAAYIKCKMRKGTLYLDILFHLPERTVERDRDNCNDHHPDHHPFFGKMQRRVPQYREGQCRRKYDPHQVGHKEQEGTVEHMPVAPSQTDTRHCDRRHQCHGDRHTGERAEDLLVGFDIGSRDTRNNRDKEIEYRRAQTTCHLWRETLYGGQQCRQCGSQQYGKHPHSDRLGTAAKQCTVLTQHPHTQRDDRLHQRRQKHRTDDHRRGVDKEPEGGDQCREDQECQERRTEPTLLSEVGKERGILLSTRMGKERDPFA